MLRRLATFAVLAAAAAASQGCDKDDPAPAAEAGAPAGDVRAVRGEVTARRGEGAARPLAVGDTVAADDVIETGADGSVEIELRHNHARWALTANQSKQVSASSAWRAAARDPQGSGVSGDRTAAAGRHAEREAADTAASAAAAEPEREVAKRDEPQQRPTAPAEPSEPVAAKKVKVRQPVKEPPKPDSKPQPKPAPVQEEKGGRGDDDPIGTHDKAAPRRAQPARARIVDVSSGDRPLDDVKAALDRAGGAVAACFEGAGLDAAARVEASLAVGADGKVTSVKVSATSGEPCVAAALRAIELPAAGAAGTVTVIYEVRP